MSSTTSEKSGKIPAKKLYLQKKIPKEPETIRVKVPNDTLKTIDEKTEDVGVDRKRGIREGIKRLIAKALNSAGEARRFIQKNVEYNSSSTGSRDEETAHQEISIEVNPNERMYLDDALKKVNESTAGEKDLDISSRDFLKGGIKWAAEEIESESLDPGQDEGRGTSSRRFEKFPGQDRGGKVVNLAITKEGKQLLDERAKEFHGSIKTSQYARECVRRMYEWVLEEPADALDFILEDQEYYQPPRALNVYQYGYQVRLQIADKRRVTRAHELLNDRFEEALGRKFKQREFLQGVARYGIEKFQIEDSDIPIV